MLKTIPVSTKKSKEMVDITEGVRGVVKSSGIKEGICVVYAPHTTSGVTINENADPDVVFDVVRKLKEFSEDSGYRHGEGNSDAHVTSTIVGASESFIIKDGNLVLGTWQGIMFVEFDGPRNRKVFVKVVKG